MLQTATANQASMMRVDRDMHSHSEGAFVRSFVFGLTAFLTIVNLFAKKAILLSLARHYDVTPAAMGFAVNATTMGMAVTGLAVGFFSQRIDLPPDMKPDESMQLATIDGTPADGLSRR